MTGHRRTRLAVVAIVLAALTGAAAQGQPLRLVKIADEDSAIRGTGHSPALHAGIVAFYGVDDVVGVTGVFTTSADGAGETVKVAGQGDPVPNNPGREFGSLSNPSVWDGVVAFHGGWGSDPDGIYLGTGGPLEVAVDQALQRFPHLGPEGVTHEIDSFYEQPFFTPLPGGTPATLADRDEPAPGGGTFATFDLNPRGPSLGGGYASFVALVNYPGGIDGGIYLADVATGALELVANWEDEMPGRGVNFEFFSHSDTDGREVVFTGSEGFVGFGGHIGVYRAPVGADGDGPLTVVAERGQTAPGTEVPFGNFGEVAVEDGLVVFVGYLDSQTEDVTGIYGHRDGELFKIINDADPLFGEEVIDFSLTSHGLDRNQLVFRGRYIDPEGPYGQGHGVYVASIAGGPSLAGPGTLAPGAEALLEVVGVEAGERVHFLASRAGIGDGPCPPALGGLCLDLLEPVPVGSATADADGVAVLSLPVPAEAPPGARVTWQAVVRRGQDGGESARSNSLISRVGG